MTNKEIKFELAKVALTRCNFMTFESLTESIKNLYEWVVEEPEVEVETEQKNIDGTDIKEVLYIVRKKQRFNSGIATILETTFSNNNINTVGDLVRIGMREFSKYRLVGKESIALLDDSLAELGVKGW